MTAQADLFTPAIQGMAEAASHADPADLASVRWHIETLAKAGLPFTAEDVRARLSEAQRDRLDAFPSAWGGTFFHMRRQRIIQVAGWATAQRPEARGHATRLWVGTQGEPK